MTFGKLIILYFTQGTPLEIASIWLFALFIFNGLIIIGIVLPIIYKFLIIPKMEVKLGKKIRISTMPFPPAPIARSGRIMLHVFHRYLIEKNVKFIKKPIKRWSDSIDEKFKDDLLLYDLPMFSKFEIFISFFGVLSLFVAFISLMVGWIITFVFS